MKLSCKFFIAIVLVFSFSCAVFAAQQEYRRLPVKVYRDKMKAGWVGQIAGVCWGAPTEFRFAEQIIPEDQMPQWKPEMINDAFTQDDLYVEMTFLRTLEQHGLDVSIRQAGIDFANSRYPLWHANLYGRKNLRSGIAPPDSSHPQFNEHADDIDYQIEADFSGLIAPGMPETVILLGDKFGRLMNYGDGLYAGVFVGAMYAEAFFEDDLLKIIDVALESIPADSQYAEMVRDVVKWYHEQPGDWVKTWNKIEEKYQKNPDYRRWSCMDEKLNIDAKINGAYILMGMLYGKGNLDDTIIISTRCGQDSDCNPSNAAGVLFTTLGFSKLPARFSEKLDEEKKFSHTEYNFPLLIDVCEKLVREAVIKEGGEIEKDENGEEVFLIPIKKPRPGPYMKSWDPGPIANSVFTSEEKDRIEIHEFRNIQDALSHTFPGWSIRDCGPDMNPGIHEFRERTNVLVTHPKKHEVPCVLSRDFEVPGDKNTTLLLEVSHSPHGDWDLIVKVDGEEIYKQSIGPGQENMGEDGWGTIRINLDRYKGKKIKLELLNQPSGWSFEGGYWSKIEFVH